MSLAAVIDGEPVDQLATNVGWGEVIRWAESLEGDYPELSHLTEWGWSQELEALAGDLDRARSESEPPPHVAHTLDGLRSLLDAHRGADVISVSDGFEEEGEAVTEAVVPNKTGPGCHDTETGHPAPCPGRDEPPAAPGAAGPEDPPEIKSKLAKAAGYLKGLPRKTVAKVRAKVADKYAKLSARYGPRYAKAIVAAALAALPVPVPGATLLAAAPFVIVAELHRALKGRGPAPALATEAAEPERELTPEEIEQAAAELVAELVAELQAEFEGKADGDEEQA